MPTATDLTEFILRVEKVASETPGPTMPTGEDMGEAVCDLKEHGDTWTEVSSDAGARKGRGCVGSVRKDGRVGLGPGLLCRAQVGSSVAGMRLGP